MSDGVTLVARLKLRCFFQTSIESTANPPARSPVYVIHAFDPGGRHNAVPVLALCGLRASGHRQGGNELVNFLIDVWSMRLRLVLGTIAVAVVIYLIILLL